MTRWIRLSVVSMLLTTSFAKAQQQVTGIVLALDKAHHALVVSCDEIPGTMSAMEMSFTVRDWSALQSIHAGNPVRFVMLKRGHVLYAEKIQAQVGANLESEPMDAAALGTLQAALAPGTATPAIAEGEPVPDFELTDQAGNTVRLSSLLGKVVLLTFGYSRCPNPDYCVRLSNNLARVRDRFAARSPRDLVLITIAIDPEHDQGETLREYAAVWKADPANWHFLTGPLPQVKRVAAIFGMNFWRNEGLLTHSLHTVVIDRKGTLRANLEGNAFTAKQLGDLVQSIMDGPR